MAKTITMLRSIVLNGAHRAEGQTYTEADSDADVLVAHGAAYLVDSIDKDDFLAGERRADLVLCDDTGRVSVGGADFKLEYGARTPVIVFTGDHPYQQWWGTNGRNGLAQMYLDRGIRPVIAINAGPPDGPGGPDMMSWEQCRQLQRRGVEFVSHGYWHVDKWNRINTGIRVEYIGSNSSATVQVIAGAMVGGVLPRTSLACVSASPSNDSVTSVFSTDDTLAKVKATIEANGKWRVTLDPILAGDEPSTHLLGMNAARDVLANARNTYFCAGGGIELRYASLSGNPPTSGLHAWARRNASATLAIFLDGVMRDSHTATTGDLATQIARINAIAGGEFRALPCDNGYTENSQKPTYMIGDELEANLSQINYVEFGSRPAVLEAGLPQWYIIDRHIERTYQIARENGIRLKHFAQSGGNFYPWMTSHRRHGLYRGNVLWRQTTPYPMRRDRIQSFVTHRTLRNAEAGATYYGDCVNALLDAMSGHGVPHKLEPWAIVVLMHKLKVDGTSGYALPTTNPSYYDQIEADFVSTLTRAQQLVKAGLLRTATMDQLATMERAAAPGNLFFNPALQCAANRLPAAGGSDGGYAIPGWGITRAATVSAMTVADGALSLTNSSASATEFLFQDIELEPGKTYELRAFLDVQSYVAGAGIQWSMQALHGNFRGLIAPETHWKFTGPQSFQSGELSLRVAVPDSLGWVPAQVRASSMQTVVASNSGGSLLLTYANDWQDGAAVQFNSSGNLPGGLTAGTTYYLKRQSATTAQVSATQGGSSIAFSTAGSGTHTGWSTLPPKTFDLSVNKNIKVNILSLGASADIDCSGAVPAATTPKEIAAKINAALAADTIYSGRAELHGIASVENGYLVLNLPYVGIDQASALAVQAGSTASAVAAIFGNATVSGYAMLGGSTTAENFVARVALRAALQGTYSVREFSCRQVEYN